MRFWLARPCWLLILGCLVVSLCLELLVFNYKYWLQFVTSYERLVVLNNPEYSQEAAQNTGPVVVDSEHNILSIAVPHITVRNVRIDAVHPNNPELVVRGLIATRTDEIKYLDMRATNFILSTKHEVRNNIVLPKEKVTRELKIEFELPPGGSFYLNSIILNDDFKLAPNFGRILLCFLPLAALVLIFKYRLYAQDYQPTQRRWGYGVLAFNVCLVLSILLFNNTITGYNAKSQCLFPQQCSFDYGAEPGSLLQKRPESYDERFNSNAYHQQFDAWLKGQTALDVAVDPRVSNFDDLYDPSEFYKNNVGWLFDHVIYEGKYYNYYGVAPLLLVYAPVYALTGMFPTPILVTTVLALIGVFASFWALSALVRVWGLQPNLLLYLLAQMALPGMALLYFGQTEIVTAQQTCLSGYAMGLLLVASGTETLLKAGKARLALAALSSAALVLLVLSRPHILFVALLFFVPLFLQFVGRNWEQAAAASSWNLTSSSELLAHSNGPRAQSSGLLAHIKANLKFVDVKTCVLVVLLVGLGALGVMTYNYVRFGGVANFGESLMVTAAVNLGMYQPSYDLPALLEALYHTFLPTVHLNEAFPFVEASQPTVDDLSYYPFPHPTIGLFAFSANYALFLLLIALPQSSNDAWLRTPLGLKGRSFDPLRLTLGLVLGAVCAVAVFNPRGGGSLLTRYSLDAAWAAALVALLLLLSHIKWQGNKNSCLLYLIVVGALLSSALVGYLLNFIPRTAFITQPTWYIELYNTFRPFIVQA